MNRLFDRWECYEGESPDWAIRCDDPVFPVGRALCLPDIFLSMPERDWLTERSLPHRPMSTMTPARSGLDPVLTSPEIPIIFGDGGYRDDRAGPAELGIDVFGSAFFMLSRYEELVIPERDAHDRFPSTASVAQACGFVGRPIIDEYVEILWAAMVRLWPKLQRKPARFQVKPSHDVDEPSRDAFRGLKAVLKESAGDVLKRRDFKRAWEGPWHWMYGQWRLHPEDEFNTFERLMDLSDEVGTKSTFFFMTGCTDPRFDRGYPIGHRAIGKLLHRIHERGHEIGLHPSFETFRRPDLLAQEAERLMQACRRLNISQTRWGARMHYLRWSLPHTWHALESAGLDFDATLGYADRVGFRCGTCHEYQAFDARADRALDLSVQPLTAMDVSVMGPQYMDLGTGQAARAELRALKRRCEAVGGSFTLLWHNNHLGTHEEWSLYQSAMMDSEP
jgi:hypothetical protein